MPSGFGDRTGICSRAATTVELAAAEKAFLGG
jgi:hypothetical protein